MEGDAEGILIQSLRNRLVDLEQAELGPANVLVRVRERGLRLRAVENQ